MQSEIEERRALSAKLYKTLLKNLDIVENLIKYRILKKWEYRNNTILRLIIAGYFL